RAIERLSSVRSSAELGSAAVNNEVRSRGVALVSAVAVLTALVALNVTAPSAVLAQRIAARGRESSAEIAARVARPVDPPHGRDVIEFVNDAPFAAARAYFVALLQAWSP
ncbi:MAG: hypothetical protein ACXWKQ_01425, partial [Reyranella sp.]